MAKFIVGGVLFGGVLIEVLLSALWLMVPAYVANPMAVVFGGGKPIDFGKNFFDGRRVLGDGKTYNGLVGGVACGVFIGFVQMNAPVSHYLGEHTLSVVYALSIGALLGDLVESFVKRRLGFRRGAKFPVADQLDFVVGAFMLTYLLEPVWFTAHFTSVKLVMVIVATPLLHRLTNIVGYRIKLKKEPW